MGRRHVVSTLGVALFASLLVFAVLSGCEPSGPKLIPGKSLRYAYRGMGYDCGTILLRLADDGRFALACVPPGDASCDTLGVCGLSAVGGVLTGTWDSRGGDLTLLVSDDPGSTQASIVFTECEVEAAGKSELLHGLRWVSSTRPSFADSSKLVARDDLQEFLYPSAGSGSSTSAL